MRLLLQRVREARVRVDGNTVGEIGPGLLVLAGFGPDDEALHPLDRPATPRWRKFIDKMLELRVFADAEGRLNLSLRETGGGLLLVPQFTLYADCAKGRRPSFHLAARPQAAARLFARLAADCAARLADVPACRVATGVFGADMDVELVNHGPVTILLDDAQLG